MSAKAFHHDSTASEVIEGHDLTGYNVIVTGGNSGIGVETVRALAKAGATCFMTSRSVERAQSVLEDIVKTTGNSKVYIEQLELDSLDNVNSFVQRFLAKNIPLHILINNAGVMACPLTYTKDGIESQFGVNHIGHFALTTGLIPCLIAGVKESSRNSRVVNLSSTAHALHDVIFEDYNFKTTEYDPNVAYGQSKTANILFTIGLNNRYAKDGIYSNAVMPGVIFTNLQRHSEQYSKENLEKMAKLKSVEAGASTTVWAAVDKELDGKGGFYLENCNFSVEKDNAAEIMKTMTGYLSYAVNQENVEKLWVLSEKIIKKD